MPSTLPLHVEDLDLNGYFVHPDEVAARDAAGPLLEQWHLYSLADAYAPRSPRRYVVDGLLPYPSLSVVYGGPGSLKSMLLADLPVRRPGQTVAGTAARPKCPGHRLLYEHDANAVGGLRQRQRAQP